MRKSISIVLLHCLLILCSNVTTRGKEVSVVKTVEAAYPGLTSGVFTHAVLDDLPDGTLLLAEGLAISVPDLDSEIDKNLLSIQRQLNKNKLFLLEQIATEKLLLIAARNVTAGPDVTERGNSGFIQEYLKKIVDDVTVTDSEIASFYEENRSMMGGVPLEGVKEQIKSYLVQTRQQQEIENHIRNLGRSIAIKLSSSWVAEQATLAMDNPVDKARSSGKPTLADFGADGCIPCDMMTPILETLRKKYEGKLNVVFVHVRKEQILASRYGIQSIPEQIFFDKDGRIVHRHVGFFAQAEIENKLKEIGME